MMRGISFPILIALISIGISSLHAGLDSLAISIILGMLIGNLLEKRSFLQPGLNICIRYCLPTGIVLYGSQLIIKEVSLSHLIIVPALFLITFFLTLSLSRLAKMESKLSILLASGLSVCGASAIVVLSPLVGAKREETSLSIISIMVVGLIGLVIYPLFWSYSGLTDEGFALFSGTTLPMIGQVKVVGRLIGEDVLTSSMNFKLSRVFLLMFLIVWFGLMRRGIKSTEETFTFPYAIRLFLVTGFILLVILTNTLGPSVNLQELLGPFSKFFLTVTLAAIGLSVDFDAISKIGPRPLYTIISAWLISGTVAYLIGKYYV